MTPIKPITVISGYLGAGKTTLVNALLREATSIRFAVLVNDFGDLEIDADLILARDGNLISIAGGCICCSFGDDLTGTLLELTQSGAEIDHFLIETSGVALPLPLVRSLSLIPGIAVDGIITLVDAETVQANAKNRYIGDTVRQQLEASDLLVINKLDLVSSEKATRVQDWLRSLVPDVRIVSTRHGVLPQDIVLGDEIFSTYDPKDVSPWVCHEVGAYRKFKYQTEKACDPASLVQALTKRDARILRAKGFVKDLGGRLQLIQIVGRRAKISPAPDGLEHSSRLVLITLSEGEHDRDMLDFIDAWFYLPSESVRAADAECR